MSKTIVKLLATMALLVVSLAGCSFGGARTESPTHLATAVSTEAPEPLPFISKFANRRNIGNNGTSYEPCNSLTDTSARELNILKSSASDAAIVDGQTARGCNWDYVDDRDYSISQIVGNSLSLDDYKKAQLGPWHSDLTVHGRRTAVGTMGTDTCSTHVQSQRAIVSTVALTFSSTPPPVDEICARAIAFTQATIDKMPR